MQNFPPRQSVYSPIGPFDVEKLMVHLSGQADFMVLRSAQATSEYGAWTYLCFDAFATFHCKNADFFWCNERIAPCDPFVFLQQRFDEYALVKNPQLPAFQGGGVGYIAYEALQYVENLPLGKDGIGLPDMVINFYNTVIAIHEETQCGYIIACGFPEKNEVLRLDAARKSIEKVRALLEGEACRLSKGMHRSDKPVSNFDLIAYCGAVNRVKDYIRQGDLFQANITQQFQANLPNDFHPLSLYLQLMQHNPSPFSAFLALPNKAWIISASPERFVKLDDRFVETCPIKGTRKRSSDAQEDSALARALQQDEKDRSENIMIVDLMRNDLSRVCQKGSIEVPELCALKSYATVHHLVSNVRGQLKEHFDAWDVLKATFPPGSVTGAPKMRAIEIIQEIEQQARGPYCGCLGYWSFTKDMDTAVTIRTYFVNQNQIFFSAGGAVVLDSCAQSEYQESLQKAKALLEVLSL